MLPPSELLYHVADCGGCATGGSGVHTCAQLYRGTKRACAGTNSAQTGQRAPTAPCCTSQGLTHFYKPVQRTPPVGQALRKRMVELASLSHSLPGAWDGSVAVRVDETDCSLLKVLIVGPTCTPYANGCFLFDMLLPEGYPLEPPKVHLITTQPCTRFNPNLYADGSVCLSLLGTWSGPGWIANTSTILQVRDRVVEVGQ